MSGAMSGIGPWRLWVRRHLELGQIEDANALEVIEQIAQLHQEHYEDLRQTGLSAAEARDATRAHVDDWRVLRDQVMSARSSLRKSLETRTMDQIQSRSTGRGGIATILGDLISDALRTVRTMRTSPGYCLVVVLTLALGIGATTAIYSVVDAVVLRPLPYPEADRLGVITFTGQGIQGEIVKGKCFAPTGIRRQQCEKPGEQIPRRTPAMIADL